MNIRQTTPADLDSVMRIYELARAFMRENGNPSQWGLNHPARALVEEDIALGRSYVCDEDGKLWATFMLLRGQEPTYAAIDGAWLDDLPYCTLHRVASTGEKRGMMDCIVKWALTQCPRLRGDTHEDNLPMRKAFERNGFIRCGVIRLEDGTPRIAYEHPGLAQKEENSCSPS